MKLGKIFEMGHTLALSKQPRRHVVRFGGSALWPVGFYVLGDESVAAVVLKKETTQDDLARPVSKDEDEATYWTPDMENCWCEPCASARRFSRTRMDDD